MKLTLWFFLPSNGSGLFLHQLAGHSVYILAAETEVTNGGGLILDACKMKWGCRLRLGIFCRAVVSYVLHQPA